MHVDLRQYLTKNRKTVNTHLLSIVSSFDQNRELIMAMKHSLMAGGKRLRPILSLAAAEACQAESLLALPVGCAIEMIHTYSLIHDDLPSMDDDDIRRGQPTCHKKFSEAIAVLAGDALLTHAFHVLANPEPVFKRFPDDSTRIKLIAGLSAAAGIDGMVEGQMMDMYANSENPDDPLSYLEKIHALKTGKMIRVSIESGALSVNADTDRIEKLSGYADKIGLAFQVADDILDVEGDPEVMGKAAGSDEIHDKMTFPALIGLEQSKKYAGRLVADAMDLLSSFGRSADPLRLIADYIINRDH